MFFEYNVRKSLMEKLLNKFFFWFAEILTKFFIYIESKRQNKLSIEFKKYNLWNLLSTENDKFIFLDIGFMPNFEYRIKEYFSNNSQFYGIDASKETNKYNKKKKEIVLNKLINSKKISFPVLNKYAAFEACEISSDSSNSSKDRSAKLESLKLGNTKIDEINLRDYFKHIKVDFIKSDLDSMDMITLYELEDKFRSKETLGVLIEVLNGFEFDKLEKAHLNSFDKVYNFMNKYNYRLFEQTNVRTMRKAARKYEFHTIYGKNNKDWINSEKGQINFGDMLFFLDPREIQNQISYSQMNKLLSLLDCYDLSDVAFDFLENSSKHFKDFELNSKIKEILKKRIRSNYKNYNPLDLKEIYLKGSINK